MGLFGTGLRRICAVVAASTAAEMSKMVRSALRQTRTVELRLDWLSSDAERARFLDWLGKGLPRKATFLATCRRREGGGKFAGAVDRELYWLIQAREVGCQWCDIGVETLRKLPGRSEEHTSELQSRSDLVCRLLLEKKKKKDTDLEVMQASQQS